MESLADYGANYLQSMIDRQQEEDDHWNSLNRKQKRQYLNLLRIEEKKELRPEKRKSKFRK